MAVSEYRSLSCRHEFPWFKGDSVLPNCPRCGGVELKLNPWLLLTGDSESVTDEDHFETLLAV